MAVWTEVTLVRVRSSHSIRNLRRLTVEEEVRSTAYRWGASRKPQSF